MLVDMAHCITFWLTPWSAPFRAACLWFTPDTQPLQGRKPNTIAPRWVRPFFVQRWVGEAIAARLAANPATTAYRFGHDSDPDWDAAAWASYPRAILRQLDEQTVLGIVGMEVERLLRIAQEHPGLVGQVEWTGAALSASEHLAQLYAELKRRHKAMQARALLREELRRFVAWEERAAEASEASDLLISTR
ncbi:MAG TPA: hypothetical protein VKT82_30760 [Ktedonobacterales bacterium]|nr:hypothetical protein [Ktedonobacterales bacterium]